MSCKARFSPHTEQKHQGHRSDNTKQHGSIPSRKQEWWCQSSWFSLITKEQQAGQNKNNNNRRVVKQDSP